MLFFTHDDCDQHITPPGHPERVDRLVAVRRAAGALGLAETPCPMGDEADVLRVHPQSHIDRLRAAVPRQGWAQIDGDTILSPGSLTAAMLAVGGVTAAVDYVVTGQAKSAFVACRPPGHHAETATAMGFCLFGTLAIGAKRALDHHGLTRVAIVDFDVHHGNGTQDLVWDEARCLFISSHQMPLYPGSGHLGETGAHGQILNIPLREGSGGGAMRATYEAQVFPRLKAYDAQLLLISAGFDAHGDDPLAGLEWQADDYRWLTERLCDFAGGRVVSCLEGGYDLAALESSVAAHLAVLKEKSDG
jgi:acetoin utilization deacetylase AcuC-like enzyme